MSIDHRPAAVATEVRAHRIIPGRDEGGHHRLAVSALTVVVGYVLLSAVLSAAGLLITHLLAPVRHWDDHVNSWFAAHRTSGWDRISKDGTFIANTLGVLVVAVLVTAFGLLRRWGRTAALILTSLVLELAVFLTVNYIVARPRPSAPHIGSTPSTYSFPSGHVAATFVLYGGIAMLVVFHTRVRWARVAVWFIAAVLATWVAFSRVYEAQHHPADVIAGLFTGMGALAVTVLAIGWPVPASTQRPGAAHPEEERT